MRLTNSNTQNTQNTLTAIAPAVARERVLTKQLIQGKTMQKNLQAAQSDTSVPSKQRHRIADPQDEVNSTQSKVLKRQSKEEPKRPSTSNAYPIRPKRKTHRAS